MSCVKNLEKSKCKKVINKIIDLTEFINPYSKINNFITSDIYGYCWS